MSALFQVHACDVYLFDIDGTLLNTRDLVHYNALNRAMLEIYGVDTTIDGIRFHGKTDLGILRATLARAGVAGDAFQAKLPLALDVVRREVTTNLAGLRPEICSGVPELIKKLDAAGKLLGVASGNLEVVGWHKVQAAGLRQYFSFGYFSDHWEMRAEVFQNAVSEARRRAGDSASICFIGDTPDDILAARQAGAQVIAVSTGIYKSDELLQHHPDMCVCSCAELLTN
jgi:phosphoglycolate phosphatase